MKKEMLMLGTSATDRFARLRRLLFPLVVLVLLFQSPMAHAQATVKVNDNVNFRFGTLIQAWGDDLQDATTRGYANNVYLRRVRLIVSGQVAKNVSFFLQTDNPNFGKTAAGTAAPKGFTGTFLIQDAWVEWKPSDAFALNAGEMLIPLDRLILTSSASNLTLDISPTATVATGAITQGNGNRDFGFEGKGYLADGRLEYRAALMQGVRDAASRNPLRKVVFLNYDFWEKERGYTYAGTNLGKRKILAISGGVDKQKDYKAYSGAFNVQVPMAGNEFAVEAEGVHYDGGAFIRALPIQNDLVADIAYYVAPARIQPYIKFEKQDFKSTTNAATTDQARFGVGANYYISGQNLKVTAQLLHVKPRNSAIHSTNEATIQFQIYYY
jgi:hypothetical protein